MFHCDLHRVKSVQTKQSTRKFTFYVMDFALNNIALF